MKNIRISTARIAMDAELNDSPTAQKLWEALPVEGNANIWGDEIYFEIPVDMAQEPDARQDMEVGELGYWPMGRAFCIFFGPTPVSTSNKPRAYTPVNALGLVIGDAAKFKAVKYGETIKIEKNLNIK